MGKKFECQGVKLNLSKLGNIFTSRIVRWQKKYDEARTPCVETRDVMTTGTFRNRNRLNALIIIGM